MSGRALLIIILVVVVAPVAAWRLYRNVWFESILLSNNSGYEGEEPMYLVIEDEVGWGEVWGLATATYLTPPNSPR